MIPGFQARWIESSSHQSSKFSSPWSYQTNNRVQTRSPDPATHPPRMSNPGPQESMKSTQIHLKSHKIDEIHRKSSRGPQILQFHGNPWKSQSELPASMIPNFRARCIESSSHRVIESSSHSMHRIIESSIHRSHRATDLTKLLIGPRLGPQIPPDPATGCKTVLRPRAPGIRGIHTNLIKII